MKKLLTCKMVLLCYLEENLNKQKESFNLISSSITLKILLTLFIFIPACVILILAFCDLLTSKETNISSNIETTQNQTKN